MRTFGGRQDDFFRAINAKWSRTVVTTSLKVHLQSGGKEDVFSPELQKLIEKDKVGHYNRVLENSNAFLKFEKNSCYLNLVITFNGFT